MEIVKSAILGVVQGLTEFLPVSSSGHLVIVPFLFRWEYIPVYYIVLLHFSTLLSLITVFYKDIWQIIKAFFVGLFNKSGRADKNFKLSILIIIASIPAAVVGFFLENYIDKFFSKPIFVGIFLLATALILVIGETIGKISEIRLNKRANNYNYKGNFKGNFNKEIKNNKNSEYKGLNFISAAVIGIGQAIAILPGISRSGTTISFGRFFGIKRQESVRFSMLLSIVVIFGAFIIEISSSYEAIFLKDLKIVGGIIISFLCSYFSGVFAIKALLNLSKNKNLNFFALYCIVVGITVIVLSIIKKI